MANDTVPTDCDVTALGVPPDRIARMRVEGAIALALGALVDVRHTLDARDIGDADRRQSMMRALDAAGHNLVEGLRRLDPGHRPAEPTDLRRPARRPAPALPAPLTL